MAMRGKLLLKSLIRLGSFACPIESRINHVSSRYITISLSLNVQRPGKSYGNVKLSSTVFEVTQGVGGSEAMLFSEELLDVYMRYFTYKNWAHHLTDVDKGSIGIRSAKVLIQSAEALEALLQEAGGHRVQRVPKTEKSGRLHTSTALISVTPKSVLDIKLDDKDLEIKKTTASGPGGQFVNKVETAVRIVHKPTGLAVECQETRQQASNIKIAKEKMLKRMIEYEMDKMTSQLTSMRRSQVKHGDRNEKIRTFNFPQDRITDHRTNKSYHKLRALMDGDSSVLDSIISDITFINADISKV